MDLFYPKGVVCMRATLDAPGFEIACHKKRSAILYIVHKPRVFQAVLVERSFFFSFVLRVSICFKPSRSTSSHINRRVHTQVYWQNEEENIAALLPHDQKFLSSFDRVQGTQQRQQSWRRHFVNLSVLIECFVIYFKTLCSFRLCGDSYNFLS